MNTSSVWQLLADIKIGTLIAWCLVIIAIIASVIKGVKSVYTFICKYNELKGINERQSKMLEEHKRLIETINTNLLKIGKSLDEQKDINMKYVRHIIVEACHEAIKAKGIQIEQLASLEEMYDEYVNVFNGNSYVSGLVARVRKLDILDNIDD